MKDLQIIRDAIDVKKAFGSLGFLDKFKEYDLPSIMKFARIVSNYLAMQEKLNENNSLGNVAQ